MAAGKDLVYFLGIALFAAGVILPALLGLLSESIARTRLFGRLPDALVGLVAGCIAAYLVYHMTHYVRTDYSQRLDTIERIDNWYMLRDGAIFAVVAIVCAAIVLFALRAALGRSERPPALRH